jgi:hypothetical protein
LGENEVSAEDTCSQMRDFLQTQQMLADQVIEEKKRRVLAEATLTEF